MKMKNKIKRPLYLFCSAIFGLFLFILLWALIDLELVRTSRADFWSLSSFLAAIMILGTAFGFFVGRIWWRIVYVEHRHWRN
ncbi:MAG: hypothetical protein P4L62_04140 [Candidatus Pacebacteria bacterium]|nr:hypothetical protein [Candidatus Paceibacterota bacterium]MDR3583521.1 hypothetical protein [Candidatus Paceibacterota bacterium]